jgi:hypothetical protein
MSPIFSLQRLYVQLVQLLIILRANIGIQKKKLTTVDHHHHHHHHHASPPPKTRLYARYIELANGWGLGPYHLQGGAS